MTRHFSLIAAAMAVAVPIAVMLAPAAAQAPDQTMLTAERTAMAKFAWMDGTWRGPATTTTPDGEYRVTQTERVGPMLDSTIRVIEGKGYNPDGKVGFNAFAIVSYDPAAKTYRMHSYAQGRVGDFRIKPFDDGKGTGYVWEIPAGPAIIRYTATLVDGHWHEIGERIVPGQPPVRFFEMTLDRVGHTDWPAAGGPAAR